MRYVARGSYLAGPRRGQRCVIKWLKSGMSDSKSFFDYDLKVVDATIRLTQLWNEARFIDQRIRVNKPSIWKLNQDFGAFRGIRVLVEPYIEGFQKCALPSASARPPDR